MTYREKYKGYTIDELKKAHEELRIELDGYKNEDRGFEDRDAKKINALLDECDYIKAQIQVANPSYAASGSYRSEPRKIDFAKIGRDIQAMVAASAPADFNLQTIGEFPIGRVDPRLQNFQHSPIRAAATGQGESVPSDGGFLVGEDLETAVMQSLFSGSPLLNLIRTREVSVNSNRLKINAVDETSRVDGSRWGGVQGYWLAEAASKTASKKKYRQIDLELQKVAALTYATDESLMDAAVLGQDIVETHAEELRFKIQDAIINGTGAGQPLGVLNSGALVSVAKESGQAATTILWENVKKMWSRYIGGPGVWLINRDIVPELYGMSQAVGTGGAPVYLPASQGGTDGAAYRPLSTLMGWPVIEIEQAATLGTVGDIILMDPMAYIMAVKKGVQTALSIHVAFTTDETVIRSVARVDGEPMLSSAVVPFKGSATRSPYVALATRS